MANGKVTLYHKRHGAVKVPDWQKDEVLEKHSEEYSEKPWDGQETDAKGDDGPQASEAGYAERSGDDSVQLVRRRGRPPKSDN